MFVALGEFATHVYGLSDFWLVSMSVMIALDCVCLCVCLRVHAYSVCVLAACPKVHYITYVCFKYRCQFFK